MHSIKKIFAALLIFFAPNVTFAESEEIPAETEKQEVSTENKVNEFSAEGEYRLGDNDTRASAKIKALNDAKRKIAEQIGVYVQSFYSC